MSKMGGGHGGDVTRKHVVTVALHLGLLYIPLSVGQGLWDETNTAIRSMLWMRRH